MSDLVLDSSVVAKWILPEADSLAAQRLITDVAMKGERLFVLDLAIIEVANAIWKRHHQSQITSVNARRLLARLWQMPVRTQPATALLASALEIAIKHDRAVYDALFVALVQDLNLPGITADEPLWRAVHGNVPGVTLLRDWP